jgi:hypothetical protein
MELHDTIPAMAVSDVTDGGRVDSQTSSDHCGRFRARADLAYLVVGDTCLRHLVAVGDPSVALAVGGVLQMGANLDMARVDARDVSAEVPCDFVTQGSRSSGQDQYSVVEPHLRPVDSDLPVGTVLQFPRDEHALWGRINQKLRNSGLHPACLVAARLGCKRIAKAAVSLVVDVTETQAVMHGRASVNGTDSLFRHGSTISKGPSFLQIAAPVLGVQVTEGV